MVRLGQLENVCSPIFVTPIPIVTVVNVVQRAKDSIPIVVTLSGMVTVVRLAQSSNA